MPGLPIIDGDPLLSRNVYGIALSLVPGADATLRFELQRAPDSAGAPNVGAAVTIAIVGPFPRSGGLYVDLLAYNTARWHYRARHIGDTVQPGVYSPWVNSLVYALRQEILDSWNGVSTVYPVRTDLPLMGDSRALLAIKSPAIILNGEMDAWKYY